MGADHNAEKRYQQEADRTAYRASPAGIRFLLQEASDESSFVIET